jgi:hypothetical protein
MFRVLILTSFTSAVPNPGENPRVKLVVGALANPKPRLIGTDVIHVFASIRSIHHLAGGDNLLHATYDI